ncbi:MAG: iron-containing alcohol dehydrogenase [Deltaproteobacteria bacterium]|nr:iron-containing alcohol dehydrogenase [Deltaproteobacteria bacterium]
MYDGDLNFIFRNPTKILFGKGSAGEVLEEVNALKGKKVLLVTDKFLEKSEMVEKVKKALSGKFAGMFSDIEPDTGTHIVDRGADYARSIGADCIVTVGGGSSIDTAKGIAVVLALGGRIGDHSGVNFLTGPITPHVVIPTTAGTGSEVTYAAVIKDHEKHRKLIYADNYIIPNVGILDPTMTVSMPPRVTAGTGMDAMSHCIEALHSQQANPITDGLALQGIRLIVGHLPKAVDNGKDLLARGQMQIAANVAGVAFGNAQVGVVHALAHSVGGRFGVPHGIANSILLPYCMEYNLDVVADKYRLAAQAMGVDVKGLSDEDAAHKAAEALWSFTGRIGMPQKLREVGVREEGLRQVAEDAISDGSIVYNSKPIFDPEETLKILKRAF